MRRRQQRSRAIVPQIVFSHSPAMLFGSSRTSRGCAVHKSAAVLASWDRTTLVSHVEHSRRGERFELSWPRQGALVRGVMPSGEAADLLAGHLVADQLPRQPLTEQLDRRDWRDAHTGSYAGLNGQRGVIIYVYFGWFGFPGTVTSVRRDSRSPRTRPANHDAALADALLSALDETAVRELAERLRPHLPLDSDRFLDAREAAALLGLRPDTLLRMARDGRIWARKAGREWRFRADRLEIRPINRQRP
jgi:excisionase family DNA binding protein